MRLRRRPHSAYLRLAVAATLGSLLCACGGRPAETEGDAGPAGSVVVPDAGPLPVDGSTGDEAPEMDATIDASVTTSDLDAGDGGDGGWTDTCGHHRPDVFADEFLSLDTGPTAGFGQDQLPCIVLGPPVGAGPNSGSTDVVSLGAQGTIVVRFDDVDVVDGPGPDLIVFENPFPGWLEPGFVAVSEDGGDWHEWPCQPQDADAGYPYCSGIHPVLSNPSNGVPPTDPAVAGGDDFDLADIGVSRARYVRIRDSGFSHYGGTTGGFDLDAVAAVHSTPNGN